MPAGTGRLVYGAVIGLIAAGGLFAIVELGREGGKLPGGGVPVMGTVVVEHPGLSGTLDMIEVTYEAGGRLRHARLPVEGTAERRPAEPVFEPGDNVALLVSRDDPERVVRPGGPQTGASPSVPGGFLAAGGVVLLAVLLSPAVRQRLGGKAGGEPGGGRGI